MSYRSMITSISVYKEGDNPLFGETSIHVSVEDEAAGPFIKITDSTCETGVCMEFDHFDKVADAVQTLRSQPYILLSND